MAPFASTLHGVKTKWQNAGRVYFWQALDVKDVLAEKQIKINVSAIFKHRTIKRAIEYAHFCRKNRAEL